MSELKEKILELSKEGKICFQTPEGVMATPINEFLSQPIEGVLYDLNRDKATVLSFIDDPKWVNDFAVSEVISYLYKKKDEYLDVIYDYSGETGMLENQNKGLTDVLMLFKDAANKFIDKVDTGKATSKETYAELKEALSKLKALKHE